MSTREKAKIQWPRSYRFRAAVSAPYNEYVYRTRAEVLATGCHQFMNHGRDKSTEDKSGARDNVNGECEQTQPKVNRPPLQKKKTRGRY